MIRIPVYLFNNYLIVWTFKYIIHVYNNSVYINAVVIIIIVEFTVLYSSSIANFIDYFLKLYT